MNPLRRLTEHIADRIHATGDAYARACGLTVQRLSWGRRVIYDSQIARLATGRISTPAMPLRGSSPPRTPLPASTGREVQR